MTIWFSDLGVADAKKSSRAFADIVRILFEKELPFVISGGLAARCYGATRPLADVDIAVRFSHEKAAEFFDSIKNLSHGATNYKDENWDVPIHMFAHYGQDFDIFDIGNCFIFDQFTKKWRRLEHDFSLAQRIGIDGMEVPVIDRRSLLQYKTMLSRDVDRSDVADIERLMGKQTKT